MERLTFDGNFCDIAQCTETPGGSFCEDGSCSARKVWERLKAYEDTHMMPHDVMHMRMDMAILTALFDGIDVDRMREIVAAERGGRVVVLPCKVGDTVYWVHGAVVTECKVHRIQKNRNGLYICLKSKKPHGAFRTDLCFGTSIFLTCEEAKKALEAMKNGNG